MTGAAPVIPDAAERRAAIDPAGSFIVQAPAGSGKTELLIQRFLALLGSVRRPDEILAITFTRKAAGEMRKRLLEALERALGEMPEKAHERLTWKLARAALDQDARCGWRLLENPALLSIQTIDSFNASLVRRMPWVTRFGGVPQIAEAPEGLYRAAAEQTLERLGSSRSGAAEVGRLLAHIDNRLDLLRDLLVALLQRRDQWLRHLYRVRGAAPRQVLEEALGELVEGRLRQALAAFPPGLQRELVTLGRYAAGQFDPDDPRPLRALADLPAFPGSDSADLPAWQGLADLLLTGKGEWRKPKGLNKSAGFPTEKDGGDPQMKAAMQQLLDSLEGQSELAALLAEIRDLPRAEYPEEQWAILEALVELLPLAVAELWLVFGEQGEVDFAEIALKALAALQENEQPSELLLKLDTRLSHILVDEFQDTSWLQYELLQRLTEGWTPGDGRTLFLVGDPMQSIYRFREAEVGLFLRARAHGIGQVALQPLRLQANFRSRQGIVDWVNATFAGIFPAAEDEARGAVPYSPAHAIHSPLAAPAVAVHPFDGRDELAEAGRVIEIIRRCQAEHPGQNVAVLVRSRTHLLEILRALRAAGLAYKAQDIDLLQDRPVARDLVSLTRALLHPGDRLAWLSVLRAPWCGLALADLHALCGEQPKRAIPQLLEDPEVLGCLSADGRERAGRLSAILASGVAQRGRIGLRRLVEGCWLALGGPACVDAAGLEDAEMVLDLLDDLDHGGDLASFDELDRGLQRLFAAPDARAGDALQVMTIHKSKGLEFDTVILPGLGRRPRQGDKPLLRWLEHPECGLLLAPIEARGGNGKDPIYETIGRLERDKEDLEVSRLLYVAATRAKSRLHLLGHAGANANGDFRADAGSLLAKLWPAVQGAFVFAGPAEAPEPEPEQKPLLPIRRLPSSWQLPELVAAPVSLAAEAAKPSAARDFDAEAALFSGWEAETGRHIGTVVHGWLERIAREGLQSWPAERLKEIEVPVRRKLGSLGVPAAELDGAQEKALRALANTLASERGRWLLAARESAVCEYPLSGVIDGKRVHAIIDRTFVDDAGVRWIIDYKTSAPPKGKERSFVDEEVEKYRGQLAAYQGLFRALEPTRQLKAALYFPLVDVFAEVGG
ncbi:ATP-dependent helicase [Desulfuromonas versatilis]|uniref:DNA 3'-5' helicase n=1 Tax=Desulfuromonas versatilis TaxID=2802975 RepID=A0ABM8HX13_9BACT|nr:UvrD-helicase domain-containing protein [Desulfuromonas versatilis]BCR05067.1 ATP-dependent helicase [Desulfuromonas versatilis]